MITHLFRSVKIEEKRLVSEGRGRSKTKRDNKRLVILFTMSLLLLNINLCYGQDNDQEEVVQNIFILSKNLNGERIISPDNNAINKQELLDLIQKLPSMIYVENGEITRITGKKPLVIVMNDLNSNNVFQSENKEFNNIELLKLKISSIDDLNYRLSSEDVMNLRNLKYIYFISEIECSEQQIQKMLIGFRPNISIIYEIIKPA